MSSLAQKRIAECKHTKSKTLNLGKCGLKSIPDEVFDCIWLEELVISDIYYDQSKAWVENINWRRDSDNMISEIPIRIEKLINLKKLYLNGKSDKKWEVNDIKPLRNLKNLQNTNSFKQSN